MKVVFVSGFLNNHILPFGDELAQQCDFHFIATEEWNCISFNRESIDKNYIIKYYGDSNKKAVQDLIVEADVAIFGGSSDELLNIRKNTGKLTFIYTERLFKKGKWRRFIPSVKKVYINRFIKNNDNVFILCASSFVKCDLETLGFNANKCFKFGYLPFSGDGVKYEDIEQKKNNKIPELLYVGRFIGLKRVGDVIRCVAMLKKSGCEVNLTLIGDGDKIGHLEKMAINYGIQNQVFFVGEQSSEQVYYYMKHSNMLILSSNRQEGWGAVVNEALNNGCPVIVSRFCGSAEYLVKNGYNGYTYKTANIKDLTDKVKLLLTQKENDELYINAHKTISECWNGKVAAKRFLEIAELILNGEKPDKYDDGPMSMA